MEMCAVDAPSAIPHFNNKRPDGFWRLDFRKPEDRAIASELWEITIRQHGENWVGETLDGKDYSISENPHDPWIIPARGVLEVPPVTRLSPYPTFRLTSSPALTRRR